MIFHMIFIIISCYTGMLRFSAWDLGEHGNKSEEDEGDKDDEEHAVEDHGNEAPFRLGFFFHPFGLSGGGEHLGQEVQFGVDAEEDVCGLDGVAVCLHGGQLVVRGQLRQQLIHLPRREVCLAPRGGGLLPPIAGKGVHDAPTAV